jgi:hypothetical protein
MTLSTFPFLLDARLSSAGTTGLIPWWTRILTYLYHLYGYIITTSLDLALRPLCTGCPLHNCPIGPITTSLDLTLSPSCTGCPLHDCLIRPITTSLDFNPSPSQSIHLTLFLLALSCQYPRTPWIAHLV